MSDDHTFDPTRVSPSRIGAYAGCGQAFKLKYLDNYPFPSVSSSSLFGTVVHKAREEWILDRRKPMVPMMERAWKTCTADEPSIGAFIQEYQLLSHKAIKFCDEIKKRRPDIKSVRATKDWKTSAIAAEIKKLVDDWLPRLNASRYQFTESDPLPSLYDESLGLAWRYSQKWRHLPNALYTEFGFETPFHGFTLNGHIDEIGLRLSDEGELLGYTVEDAKTYRQAGHEGRDKRQLVMYGVAMQDYIERGVLDLDPALPIFPVIDLMRLGEKIYFDPITDEDVSGLLDDLMMYQRGVSAGVFISAAKTCTKPWCECAVYYADQKGEAA